MDIKVLEALDDSGVSLLLAQPVGGNDTNNIGILLHRLDDFQVAPLREDVSLEFFAAIETVFHVAHGARTGSIEHEREFAAAVGDFQLFPVCDPPLHDGAQLVEVDYRVGIGFIDDECEGIVGDFALRDGEVVRADEFFLLVVEGVRGDGHANRVFQQQFHRRVFATIDRQQGGFRLAEGIKVGEFGQYGLETFIRRKMYVVFVKFFVGRFGIGAAGCGQ